MDKPVRPNDSRQKAEKSNQALQKRGDDPEPATRLNFRRNQFLSGVKQYLSSLSGSEAEALARDNPWLGQRRRPTAVIYLAMEAVTRLSAIDNTWAL
ncbi:hypothetical protein J6590_011580 [Homalodisca vitripennis]|nr:hypothetical protein J6590_011580 [Homalodisca vitripennis]